MDNLKEIGVGKNFPIEAFLSWFEAEKRDLPWRKSPSFYEVLISEVMLQQTQVQTVIPYYQRWMRALPTLHHLATASIEEVIKLWEGLGYYSRARNLHKAAQLIIASEMGLPRSYEQLRAYPGIGDYTASAILAFAYQKGAIALDGNVLRVGARYFGIDKDIKLPETKKTIKALFETLEPKDGRFAEGLIELGATYCRKKAECEKCPLRLSCFAFSNNQVETLPVTSPRKKIIKLVQEIALLEHVDKVFIIKRTIGRMKDLYEFPSIEEVKKELIQEIDGTAFLSVKRSFTHFHETLKAFYYTLNTSKGHSLGIWVEYKILQTLPFSGGHRKIRDQFLRHKEHENSTHRGLTRLGRSGDPNV